MPRAEYAAPPAAHRRQNVTGFQVAPASWVISSDELPLSWVPVHGDALRRGRESDVEVPDSTVTLTQWRAPGVAAVGRAVHVARTRRSRHRDDRSTCCRDSAGKATARRCGAGRRRVRAAVGGEQHDLRLATGAWIACTQLEELGRRHRCDADEREVSTGCRARICEPMPTATANDHVERAGPATVHDDPHGVAVRGERAWSVRQFRPGNRCPAVGRDRRLQQTITLNARFGAATSLERVRNSAGRLDVADRARRRLRESRSGRRHASTTAAARMPSRRSWWRSAPWRPLGSSR